jgi:hypothetical protein
MGAVGSIPAANARGRFKRRRVTNPVDTVPIRD